MNELARHLKDVVDTRFGGVASKASREAGLNENAVTRVLENPHHQSTLDTLDKFCQAYDWDLRDCIYWALDRTPPPLTEGPAAVVIARVLAHAGYSETDRQFILLMLERCTPVPSAVPRSELS